MKAVDVDNTQGQVHDGRCNGREKYNPRRSIPVLGIQEKAPVLQEGGKTGNQGNGKKCCCDKTDSGGEDHGENGKKRQEIQNDIDMMLIPAG